MDELSQSLYTPPSFRSQLKKFTFEQ